MTDTEAQPADPSASQPTPAPIADAVGELPEDACRAAAKAIERTVRGFTTRPNFFGQPTSMGATSEQLADAALAAALPFLERATRHKIAAEIEAFAERAVGSRMQDGAHAAARVARGGEATE